MDQNRLRDLGQQPPVGASAQPGPDPGRQPHPDATSPGQPGATGPGQPGATDPGQPSAVGPDSPGPGAAPTPPVVRHHRVRRTRTGGVWVALTASAVILLLLLIFILENQSHADIGFFGAHVSLPIGVAMLLSAVAGALVVIIPGTGRIIQLRLTARRHRRQDMAATTPSAQQPGTQRPPAPPQPASAAPVPQVPAGQQPGAPDPQA
jgi:uncharacterized integral membrane protein